MTTMNTIAALGVELRLPSLWMTWMLGICVLNGAAALACVAFALYKTTDKVPITTNNDGFVATPVTFTRQNATANTNMRSDCVCGKRKTRDQLPAFPFARNVEPTEAPITQGRHKLRRVTKIAVVRCGPRRSRSFGPNDAPPSPPSPLRRVASCGDSASTTTSTRPFEFKPMPTMKTEPVPMTTLVCAPLEEAAATVTDLLREIRLRDVLSSAKAVVVAKLREAARNAVDEVLQTIISFLTYGMLLFFVRQYSAVAVGVSLDLGAFSIEL